MIEHVFGGDWTEDKLRRLREYLIAYRHIFTGNPRAAYFKTWYVDAFAGTRITFHAEVGVDATGLWGWLLGR